MQGQKSGQKSEITRLNGLFGQAAKTLSSAMSPAKTDETAQPSSSSSSSSSSSVSRFEDEDEDDQDVSFLFPIRPQAGGPTFAIISGHKSMANYLLKAGRWCIAWLGLWFSSLGVPLCSRDPSMHPESLVWVRLSSPLLWPTL